jgi:hypothetical protein
MTELQTLQPLSLKKYRQRFGTVITLVLRLPSLPEAAQALIGMGSALKLVRDKLRAVLLTPVDEQPEGDDLDARLNTLLQQLCHALRTMEPAIHIKLSDPFSATLALKVLALSMKANDATSWLASFRYAMRSDAAVQIYLGATRTADYNGVNKDLEATSNQTIK